MSLPGFTAERCFLACGAGKYGGDNREGEPPRASVIPQLKAYVLLYGLDCSSGDDCVPAWMWVSID